MREVLRIGHVWSGARREVEVAVVVEVGQFERGVVGRVGFQGMASEDAGLSLFEADNGDQRSGPDAERHDRWREPGDRDDVHGERRSFWLPVPRLRFGLV